MSIPLAIACDHAGLELKRQLIAYLQELGYALEDLGTQDSASVDYPDYAKKLAEWMRGDEARKGLLICGSGIGISIAANRHSHVRAALVSEPLSAELARRHNDANVLCLGARLIGIDLAKECVKRFLETRFEGGRHEARVKKLG